jgi:hypothetical protein
VNLTVGQQVRLVFALALLNLALVAAVVLLEVR